MQRGSPVTSSFRTRRTRPIVACLIREHLDSSESGVACTCFGSRRSLVQIQSPRPYRTNGRVSTYEMWPFVHCGTRCNVGATRRVGNSPKNARRSLA